MRILLALSLFLSGCAGYHAIPNHGYTSEVESSKNTIRIAFDQWGDLYPESDPARFHENKWCHIFGVEMSLRDHMEKSKQEYNKASIDQHYDTLAKRISTMRSALGDDSKVVFLIHGFNNSYGKANNAFTKIKEQLTAHGENHLFIEVYWDGLYTRWKFKPFLFWPDAMVYSNYAGEYGLRRLLNKLDGISEVTFVTHSRGAAVAYSAFTKPIYDANIKNRFGDSDSLNISGINKVNMMLLAPAIGDGHKLENLPGSNNLNFNIWVGFNKEDVTLQKGFERFNVKLNAGAHKLGSTELGVIDSYFKDQVSDITNPHITLNREEYSFPAHAFTIYLDKSDVTDCLYSRVGLLSSTDNCSNQGQ